MRKENISAKANIYINDKSLHLFLHFPWTPISFPSSAVLDIYVSGMPDWSTIKAYMTPVASVK